MNFSNMNFKELLKGIENYDAKDIVKFMDIHHSVKKRIFKLKDKNYGGSWQQDGLLGAFLNWKRKIDRLLNMFKSGILFDSVSNISNETVNDTLLDCENYNTLFLYLMFRKKFDHVTIQNVMLFYENQDLFDEGELVVDEYELPIVHKENESLKSKIDKYKEHCNVVGHYHLTPEAFTYDFIIQESKK